jgi:hypothetical protein
MNSTVVYEHIGLGFVENDFATNINHVAQKSTIISNRRNVYFRSDQHPKSVFLVIDCVNRD